MKATCAECGKETFHNRSGARRCMGCYLDKVKVKRVKSKKCHKCGIEFEIVGKAVRYQRKSFCSQACASSYSWEQKALSRGDSSTVKNGKKFYGPAKTCKCGEEFIGHWENSQFCSRRCATKFGRKQNVEKLVKRYSVKLKLVTLDAMAREICRKRGSCEAAGEDGLQCSGSLQWAHIVSRTYHKTRWDDDNCLYLCAAHHFFYTNRTIHWKEFLKRKIGLEKLEQIEARAISAGKVDRIEVYKRLKENVDSIRSKDR